MIKKIKKKSRVMQYRLYLVAALGAKCKKYGREKSCFGWKVVHDFLE